MFHKYKNNPILSPNPKNEWEDFCVLNPGVIYDGKNERFVMLYRAAGDTREHRIRLGLATSTDGIHFKRESDEPAFDVDINDADGGCIEDPRIVDIGGRFYITYASRPFYPGRYWLTYEEYVKENGEPIIEPETAPLFIRKNHTTTYLAYTDDFKTYKRLGRITDLRYDDRDVVIFPEKINGKFVRLSRTKFPDGHKNGGINPSIWISYSDDLMEWDGEKLLLTGNEWWENAKVGAGCPPFKTEFGWVLIYHGVNDKDSVYRVGYLVLDLENPEKILYKTKDFVMEPEYEYETSGIYNGCVFPTGVVVKDGTVFIYYGCADKYISLATVNLNELLEKLKKEIRK